MPMPTTSRNRGMAAIAVIALMLLLTLVVMGMVHGTARDQSLTVSRVQTVQAFYAAEAGMNMAVREMANNADEDGDGTVGTISDDGVAGNDPAIGSARVYVSQSLAVPVTTLNSYGRMGDARRHLEADVETGGVDLLGHTTVFGSTQNAVGDQQIATQVTLSQAIDVTSITAYVEGPNKLVRYAIYTDVAGEPDTLLAETATATVGATPSWITITLPTTSLSAGTYWLALAFEHNNERYTYDSAGGQTRYNGNDAVSNGYTGTWGSSTNSSNRRISIYASSTGWFKVKAWREIEP